MSAASYAKARPWPSAKPSRSLTHAADQGKRLELRDLDRALAKLPEEQRSVILLVGLEGMRYEEVAEVSTSRSAPSARACRGDAMRCAA